MRVVVTGANGLVGSRLCLTLWERGHQVAGLFRASRAPTFPPRISQSRRPFEHRACELTNEREVQDAIESAEPEVIIHTASMTDVDGCERDPDQAFAVNVDGAAYVSRTARKVGAHLVHVSTDYVFDGENGPYSESDLPNPRGAYALTKHMGEQAVRVFAPSLAIARTAVVYGWPPASRPNFGSWLVGALQKNQPVRLFEDQLVSPSLADSVAAMLAEIAERKLTGVWNTCGAAVVDRLSFGKALCGVFGFDPALCAPARLRDAKLASPRPLHCGLRADKAAQNLAEKPLPLSEALARFYADYQRDRL